MEKSKREPYLRWPEAAEMWIFAALCSHSPREGGETEFKKLESKICAYMEPKGRSANSVCSKINELTKKYIRLSIGAYKKAGTLRVTLATQSQLSNFNKACDDLEIPPEHRPEIIREGGGQAQRSQGVRKPSRTSSASPEGIEKNSGEAIGVQRARPQSYLREPCPQDIGRRKQLPPP
jgi:hypothetical protein